MAGTPASVPLFYGRNVAQDVYAWALSASYRSGFRLYDPDYALSRDPDIYEKTRRDPVIAMAIEQRTHSVAGRRHRIEPARPEFDEDKDVAGIIEDLVSEIRRFSEGKYELATAVIRNRTYAYVEGERREAVFGQDGSPRLRWFIPRRLRDVDRRRVRIVPDWQTNWKTGERSLRTYLELFSVVRSRWLRIEHPEWFIRHVYNDEEARLGHGRGLLEAIYFWHWAKEVVLREGLQGLERWAQGLKVAKIDGVRDASTQKPNETVAAAWLATLAKTTASNSLVMDRSDDFDVYNISGEGTNFVFDFLRYLDEGIVKLITGALRPTGGGEGGSYSRAETEAAQMEALIQYDRELLDEVLTRDLVGLLYRLNRGNFVKLGLGAAKCPKFVTVNEKYEDPTQAAAVIDTALRAKIPLRKDEVYRKIGFSQPKPEDIEGGEVFEGLEEEGGFGEDPFGAGGFPQISPGTREAIRTDPKLHRLRAETGDALSEFDESKHPRAEDGKFGPGGGGESGGDEGEKKEAGKPLKIVRISSIKDTREYEEVSDDVWKPIPGSGEPRPCDRCGRDHEVHATVEVSDGTSRCVGVGCMKKENPELAKKITNADRAAKQLAKMEEKIGSMKEKRRQYDEIASEVEKLPVPEPEVAMRDIGGGESVVSVEIEGVNPLWILGYDSPESVPAGDIEKRKDDARRAWKQDKATSAYGGRPPDPFRIRSEEEAAEKVRTRLETIQADLADDGAEVGDEEEAFRADTLAEWDESKHPRAEDGKFGPDGGGGESEGSEGEKKTEVDSADMPEIWGGEDPFPWDENVDDVPLREWHKGSKIVDESGEPLVVYHGGDLEGDIDVSRGDEYGLYLTPNRNYARRYNPKTTGFHVRMTNPKIVSDKSEISPSDLTAEDVSDLIGEGYDGIVSVGFDEDGKRRPIAKADEVIVFDPRQVRKWPPE